MNWIKKNVRDTLLVIAIILSIYASVVGTVALNNDDNQGGQRVGTYFPTVVSPSITDTGLTSGRIPITGTGGLIGDDADLQFTGGDTLLATKLDAPTGRTAYVIAASNATTLAKEQADEVASGTDDQTIINAAIIAHKNVQLTLGLFTISGSIVIADLDSVTLAGMGRSGTSATDTVANYNTGTVIAAAANSDCDMIAVSHTTSSPINITIRDMTLYGNKANNTSGDGIQINAFLSNITRVNVEWISESAFHTVSPNWATARACAGITFDNCRTRETEGHAFAVDAYCYDMNFFWCYVSGVRGTKDAFYIKGGGHKFLWCEMDNLEQHGINLTNTLKIKITNCQFSAAITAYQVYIANSSNIIISDNLFYPEETTATYCISLGRYGGITYDVLITDNAFNSGKYGVATAGNAAGFSNVTICDNNFTGQGTAAILSTLLTLPGIKAFNNIGVVNSGEIRTYSGSLTAGLVGLPVMAWQNPEAQGMTVTARTLITTPSTAAAVGDLGRATTVAVVEDAEDVWNEAFASTCTLTNTTGTLTESGTALLTGANTLNITGAGTFTFALPSGYTATLANGTATVAPTGAVSDTLVIDSGATTGTITVTVTSVCTNAVNTTYVERGTNCVAFTVPVTVDTNDIVAAESRAALDISTATYFLVKLRATTTTVAGDYQLLIDETAACASPSFSLDLPALTANTTTLICLAINGGAAAGATCDAIISMGLKYTKATSVANTIYIDDWRAVTVGTELFNDLALNSTAYTSADSVTASAPLYVGAKNSDDLDCIIMYSQTQATTDLVGTWYVTAQGQ
jgi:hypothetical protein